MQGYIPTPVGSSRWDQAGRITVDILHFDQNLTFFHSHFLPLNHHHSLWNLYENKVHSFLYWFLALVCLLYQTCVSVFWGESVTKALVALSRTGSRGLAWTSIFGDSLQLAGSSHNSGVKNRNFVTRKKGIPSFNWSKTWREVPVTSLGKFELKNSEMICSHLGRVSLKKSEQYWYD